MSVTSVDRGGEPAVKVRLVLASTWSMHLPSSFGTVFTFSFHPILLIDKEIYFYDLNKGDTGKSCSDWATRIHLMVFTRPCQTINLRHVAMRFNTYWRENRRKGMGAGTNVNDRDRFFVTFAVKADPSMHKKRCNHDSRASWGRGLSCRMWRQNSVAHKAK